MVHDELLDTLRPPRLRPAIWYALADLSRRRDPVELHHSEAAWRDFLVLHRRWSDRFPRTPELASIGLDLLRRGRPDHERIEACIWLTMFPSLETVDALARVALDPHEPVPLRDQATWTLGFRQLQQAHDALLWKPEVVEAADSALAELWLSAGRDELDDLAPALRHVASPALLDTLASDCVAAAPALEAFATPKLAAALADRLEQLPSEHAPRIVRLLGHVLGRDIVPRLLAFAQSAPPAERFECLMTGLALDASAARPAVDAYLASLTFDRIARERTDWHLANPGVLPTVRALAVARTTAVVPPAERTSRCREAARNFAHLAAIEPYAEAYLYSMWRHVAFRARDDDTVVACVDSTPSMLDHGPFLVEPYLGALARAGRFERLAQVARNHAATAHATWLLATHGRPFAALASRRLATCDGEMPEAVAGGALALFLAGRPDLAELALRRDRARTENLHGYGPSTFPGPDEQWRAEHEPESCPALTALVLGGLPELLACMHSAPPKADPDSFNLALLTERENELRGDLHGASVCLVGSFADKDRITSALVAQGARIVDGPFARTDYFLAAPDAAPATVARLRAMGVRELPTLFSSYYANS